MRPPGLSSPRSGKRLTQKIISGLLFPSPGAGVFLRGFISSLQDGCRFEDHSLGREWPSPGGGSIGEGTAFVKWQTMGKIVLQSWGRRQEKERSPQWVGGAGALGQRLSVVEVAGDRWDLPPTSPFILNIKLFFQCIYFPVALNF